MSVTVNGSTGLTFNDGTSQSTSAFYGGLALRNRIINGAMVINQRGVSVTANTSTSGTYITDRFREVVTAGTGVFTVAQDTSAPVGFVNSLKATVTTAYSVAGTDRYEISQLVEGYNIADLGWGTADAKTVTLSFWVRSSLTGTFGGVIQNSNADYNYPFTYTISSANTWEYKTITVAGPTSGTWATDNTQGLKVTWSLGCGSTRLGTAGAWSSTRYEGATGQTQVIATNGATWYLTGVQLEKGSTATSFDYRPYGTELALCQRYYYKNTATTAYGAFSVYAPAVTGTAIYLPIQFPVTMRTSPSSLETSNIQVLDGVTTYTGGTFAIDSVSNSPSYATVNYTHGSSVFTQYRPYGYRGNNSATAYLAFSAEL